MKNEKKGDKVFEISEEVENQGFDTESNWCLATHTYFTPSWTSYVRTQIDYDGGFDL